MVSVGAFGKSSFICAFLHGHIITLLLWISFSLLWDVLPLKERDKNQIISCSIVALVSYLSKRHVALFIEKLFFIWKWSKSSHQHLSFCGTRMGSI